MPRTCFKYPLTVENGFLALSLDLDRDEQGVGSADDSGKAIAKLYWKPKLEPIPRTLRIEVNA